MGFVVVARTLSTAITLALYTLSPQLRLLNARSPTAQQVVCRTGLALVAIGYAIPIYALLLLASCMR
jgi:hypothetical protein